MSEEIRCFGCGAVIQSEDENEIGFVPKKALNNDKVLCKRCFRLKNYHELQKTNLTSDDFLNILQEIGNHDCLVVYLIDLFDYNGSLIKDVYKRQAKSTSQILFDQFNEDVRLKEMNFGIYEGKKIEELLNNEEYFNLWNNPDDNVRLTGGESYFEVQTRLKSFINDVYQKYYDKTIFITIHGMLFVILHGLMLNYQTKDLVLSLIHICWRYS